MTLVCFDDIDAVCADRNWCETLFHLFNRHVGTHLHNNGFGKWLVSATAPAAQINCALPDLGSRLSWGGSFRLAPLDDTGRQHMLQLQAKQRGMGISDEVAAYILRHHARDTQALLELLERIDRESLRVKQRISVNFVRKLLGDADAN
jgi:DnaA family protein